MAEGPGNTRARPDLSSVKDALVKEIKQIQAIDTEGFLSVTRTCLKQPIKRMSSDSEAKGKFNGVYTYCKYSWDLRCGQKITKQPPAPPPLQKNPQQQQNYGWHFRGEREGGEGGGARRRVVRSKGRKRERGEREREREREADRQTERRTDRHNHPPTNTNIHTPRGAGRHTQKQRERK